MTIKAIIWDFAGVLLHAVRGDFHSLLAERLDAPLQDVLAALRTREADLWDLGDLDDEAFFSFLLTRLNRPPALQAELKRFVHEDFFIDQRMLAFMRSLRPQYISILLTNFPAHLPGFLKTDWQIEGVYDHLVASYDVKLLKPDPAMYQYALDLAGVSAEQALFVDDRPANVEAADQMGIPAILCTSVEQTICDVRAALQTVL